MKMRGQRGMSPIQLFHLNHSGTRVRSVIRVTDNDIYIQVLGLCGLLTCVERKKRLFEKTDKIGHLDTALGGLKEH